MRRDLHGATAGGTVPLLREMQSVVRKEQWGFQWQVLSRSECVHGNPDYNDRYEQQTGLLIITCQLCGWGNTSTITQTRTFCPHLNRVVPTSVLLEP